MSEEDHQDSDNQREVIAGYEACSKGEGLGNLRPVPSSSLLITLKELAGLLGT